MLPTEWKELFPDLAPWFGIPLRLLKSIYGSTDAARNWDDTLADFLINDFGFERCPSARSIFIYKRGKDFIYLINAVDDQLYFSNNDKLRLEFEQRIAKRFDVELMGQAHWYLQARLTQHTNYTITLDQSRYMASIANRFLPQHPTTNITTEDKEKYKSPLPTTWVATKKDCSANSMEVKNLEDKYGFQYSSAVGMLIFLLNTTPTLQYGIRKLAKFNALPGKQHYKALIHLLHHVRTHRTDFGLQFYPPEITPPIHHIVKQCDPEFNFDAHPILLFTDSSWQDCPDTSRSTGAYILYMFGSIVDAASFIPNPVALSSAEAEYNACAFAITASIFSRQVFNSFQDRHPDSPVTIATFVDSSSAIAMMNSDRDTKRTRHIERRVHFVRQAREQGVFTPFKIPGELNPSDVGTKNLAGPVIESHLPVLHVPVPQ